MDDLNTLERDLLKNNISLEKIRDHFALLVLHVMKKTLSLNADSNVALHYLKENLSKINTLRATGTTGEISTHGFEGLWDIERKYQNSNPFTAGMARCVIHCLAGYESWEEQNQGDPTPLIYLYHDIKKNPNTTTIFIDHFYKLIN